ncbi:MAG: translocation/assembly module TamB [Deltaproteobacteria bacterium]|nr:translocation/assembly module TamB [Deltaproteobacteria bacterium]
MRPRRRIGRIAIGTTALVVALAVVAAVVSRTAAFHDWLRRQVVMRLNAELNGELTLGGLDGNLARGVVLTDLRLRSEGRRVLAVRHLAARYDLLKLVTGGGLALRDVEVSGLALALVEDERGWNVARLFPPRPEPSEQSGLDVVFDAVRVRDASIKVVRATDVWRLRDLHFTGSARAGGDGQVLTLDTLSATFPGRDVRVAELSGRVGVGVDGALRADGIHLRTDASELRADARLPGRGDGTYDVRVEVPHLAAAEVRRFLRVGVPATDLMATMHVSGPAASAAVDGTITSDAGEVGLEGNVGLGDPPSYDIRARLTDLNAAGLLGPAQPVTDLTGTLGVKGKGLTLDRAAARAVLALDDSAVSGRTLSRLSLETELAERQVTFEASTALAAGEAEARGTVGIADERYDLHLTMRGLDPVPLVGRPDLHAALNATLALAGTGFRRETARAEAHVAMTPSRVGQVAVASAKADVRAANGTLTIDQLRIDADALQLQASGTLALGVQPAAATGVLRYAVRTADLAPVARIAGAGPLAGSLAIEGSANGGLADLDVRATVTGRRLARADAAVGTLTAHVSAAGIGAGRGRADLDAHAEDLHAAGRRFAALDLKGHWQQQVGARAVANATLQVQEDARHRHELVLEAALAPRERRVTLSALRLDVGDDTWRAEGTPVITQRGERLLIDHLALRTSHAFVRVDGEAGSSGTEDLSLHVDGLDLAPFGASVQATIAGRVSATAHLGGSAPAPEVQAQVVIERPAIEHVRYESAAVDATVGGGRAVVTVRVVQDGPRQFALEASSPLHLTLSPFAYAAAGTLSGTLRASAIDLAFLDPLLPQVSKLAGTLNADLILGGTIAQPEARGRLAIAGGRAYVVPVGLTYDPIELRLTLAGTVVSIETLRIVSGNGTLTGGGSARVGPEGATIDGRFQLDRFPLFANEFGAGMASGWMWLTGTVAAPVVEGALTTDRLVLLVPESLPGSVRPPDPTITVIGPAAPAAGGEHPTPQSVTATELAAPVRAPTPGVYDRAAITVQIAVPHDAWIRRSDTNIELRGWMTAWKKPAQELALAGVIDTVRGWYSFQGKTFTLEEGRVSFNGQDFNPLLELTAIYKAGDYTVRVKIGGTLTKPTLALESEPALEQADILSVLLFGKPASALSRGESAGLREQAIGVASTYVASELRQSVADTLGLDMLQFETGGVGSQGAAVTLGKYIAPDVFVSLANRFAKQSVQEIRVEYTVRPHLSIETSSDTLGESGIDVFWKNRY